VKAQVSHGHVDGTSSGFCRDSGVSAVDTPPR
jgi:hypothetical protein